jgi:hypothetical protein
MRRQQCCASKTRKPYSAGIGDLEFTSTPALDKDRGKASGTLPAQHLLRFCRMKLFAALGIAGIRLAASLPSRKLAKY